MTTAADFGAALTGLLTESARPPKKAKRKSAAANDEEEPEAEAERKSKKARAAPILSLSAKPLPPSMAEERLERRAARALKAERAERLDRARVRNVLEGWVPAEGAGMGSQEFERALRKTAQRGGECKTERWCSGGRGVMDTLGRTEDDREAEESGRTAGMSYLRWTELTPVIKLFNAILVASKNAEAAATTLAQKAGIKPEAPKNKKEKDNVLGRGGQEQLTKEGFLDLVRRGGK